MINFTQQQAKCKMASRILALFLAVSLTTAYKNAAIMNLERIIAPFFTRIRDQRFLKRYCIRFNSSDRLSTNQAFVESAVWAISKKVRA